MYENSYNYIEVPDNNNNSNNNGNKNKAGKTVAAILAVALIGGASGYGGAYLQNTAFSDSISAAADAPSETTSSSADSSINAITVNSTSTENTVSSLLNSSGGSQALTTQQIVEKVSPSVVSVHSTFKTSQGTGSGTGTGIILNEEGYIITNAHVVQTETKERSYNSYNNYNAYDFFEYFFGNGIGNSDGTKSKTVDATDVSIILSYDEETEYEAEIIGVDPNSDIAVLKIDADNLVAAEFGNSDELTMGSKAVAIGYPLGLGLSTSEGIISGLNRTIDVELSSGGSASMTLIQTDAAINPGNSGGPLVNEYGQVVGITSSKLVDSSLEGLGFAIPITDAMPIVSDLMNQGYVINRSPQIGISGSNVNIAVARYYGLPVTSGVMVVSVEEGSGAENAGLCVGDVIIAAEGEEITSMDELTAVKNGKEIGDTITVTLARANENVDVTITLTAAESDAPQS